MKGLCVLPVLLLSVLSCCHGEEKHWALLVAGSNGYYNYRHQADICHSYHVIRSHGIPDERIIVMMYDDIAHNEENPFKGNIINQPDGPNVYTGVPKDYTKGEVTPETFLKVLTGDEAGIKATLGRNGKVIKSGPNDRIFVNFADHGAPGILAFPDEMLHAKDLHKAIKSMHKNKQYKQMVFYIEACESGSMFDGILESDIDVYATTAANPDESSYACYYDDARQTYLGDLYSVMWMQDSDKENLKKETLDSQFKLVKEEVNTSHVMQYGDLKLGRLPLADFQGNFTSNSLFFKPTVQRHPAADAVPSEDVAMEVLKRKAASAEGDEAIRHNARLQALIKRKHQTEEYFRNLVGLTSELHQFDYFLKAPLVFSDFTCYTEGVEMIRKTCPGMQLVQNDYALRKLRVLANLCESDIPMAKVWAAIGTVSYKSSIC